jgi:hypothetical protein
LIIALERYGGNEMVNVFLNSDNPILKDAAGYWAERHGYVVYQTKSESPKW